MRVLVLFPVNPRQPRSSREFIELEVTVDNLVRTFVSHTEFDGHMIRPDQLPILGECNRGIASWAEVDGERRKVRWAGNQRVVIVISALALYLKGKVFAIGGQGCRAHKAVNPLPPCELVRL